MQSITNQCTQIDKIIATRIKRILQIYRIVCAQAVIINHIKISL